MPLNENTLKIAKLPVKNRLSASILSPVTILFLENRSQFSKEYCFRKQLHCDNDKLRKLFLTNNKKSKKKKYPRMKKKKKTENEKRKKAPTKNKERKNNSK